MPVVLKVDNQTYFEMPLLPNLLAAHQMQLLETPVEDAISVIANDAPAVIVTGAARIDREMIEAGVIHGLQGIVKAGTGLDNIDCDYARSQGLSVANTPDYVSDTVAEYTFSLMLALARKLYPLQTTMHANGWLDITPNWLGVELNGKTLGLIGFGKIAKSVARIAHHGFRMQVVAYDPYVPAEEMTTHSVTRADTLEEVLTNGDVVSLHTSLNPATKNLIGAGQLAQMKPSAFLINVSRGGLVDEAALLDALLNRRMAGAALDVFVKEPVEINVNPVVAQLAGLDHVLMSPHIAWYTGEARQRLQHSVAQHCQKMAFSDAPAH